MPDWIQVPTSMPMTSRIRQALVASLIPSTIDCSILSQLWPSFSATRAAKMAPMIIGMWVESLSSL